MKRTPLAYNSTLRRSPMRRGHEVHESSVIAGVAWPAGWQSEADFQKQVEDLAAYCGWQSGHAHLPFFDTAGLPDLLLVHERTGRTVFAELKATSKTGRVPKPSPAQQRWLGWLAKKNEVYVWTWPQDWAALEVLLTGERAVGA